MKNFWMLVLAGVFTAGCVQFVGATTVKESIAERIKKVGTVCIQGEDCASGSASTEVAAASGAKSPEDIYNQACATCHAIGVAGAPKLGDVAQWAPRIDKGIDVLYGSVLNGLAPGMPAKGMCFTCSDDELRSVTDYMVSQAQ
ncbi:MAG: c-type cytochrome [Pseudomonadota bacterium]